MKYQALFGSGSLDLSDLDLSQQNVRLKLDSIFGELKVTIPKAMPIIINSNSVFAEIRLPKKNLNAFGTFSFESDEAKTAPYKLTIDANAVFGSIKFKEN